MPRAALALALAGMLAIWAAPPAQGQEGGPKRAIAEFIKAGADFPDSYQPLDWSQAVKLSPGGPYLQAVRHLYRIMNAEAGRLITVDEIFYLDHEGQVMGTTNTTPRWRHKRWGAGKEKW